MRVLHLISDLDFKSGGPAKACVEMAKTLSLLGHQVKIFTTTYSRDGDHEQGVFKENGVEIHYYPVQFPKFLKTSLALAKALAKEIAHIDVLHIHSLYLFHNMIGGWLARKHQMPYIIRPHSILSPYIRRRHRLRKFICELLFENRNIRYASAIHFTAEDERNLAKPYTFGTQAVILPLGLYIKDYENLPAPGNFKNSHKELADKKLLLFLGRINFKKGFDLLIPAFKKLVENIPESHLVIAGPDSDGYQRKVQWLIEKHELLDHVSFVGSLRGEEKLAAFVDAELFILPSYAENFGIAVVEAMACGVPVLISDQVNICKEIIEAKAGVVTACNIQEIAEGLKDFFGKKIDSLAMRSNAKKLVAEKYNWSTLAKQYEKMYLEITKNKIDR